jgi:hypothetical protein
MSDEPALSIPPLPTPPETVGMAFSRCFNIIANPGEVYEEWVNAKPNFGNVWVPMSLLIITIILFSLVVFSQEAIVGNFQKAQAAQMEKNARLQNLSQAQIDKQQEIVDKFMSPTMFKIFGIVGGAAGTISALVIESFAVMLILKWAFKTRIPFGKVLELTALSYTILIFGTLATLCIVVMTSNIAMNVGPSLLVKNFDGTLKLHQFLSVFNLMTMWQLGVSSLGMAKLSGRKYLPVVALILLVWAALRSLIIFGNPLNYHQ